MNRFESPHLAQPSPMSMQTAILNICAQHFPGRAFDSLNEVEKACVINEFRRRHPQQPMAT
jgi:hypothetical protein